jgi:SAM-dependent methyltransferase
MSQTSSKPFGPIRDAYAFFQQHATATEADIRAYRPPIHGVVLGNSPLRLLDFGCGDGGFSAALLGSLCFPPARLRLALVEPDDVYRHQAVEQLQPYSTQPVRAWPALPPHLHACFDLVVANHVLYYVPDLDGTLLALLGALANPGLLLAAMAGWANALAQICLHCFDVLGKPFPFHTAEDCEAALVKLGEAYSTENVQYDLVFPDAAENRLTMGRFLLGGDVHAVPRPALLQCFAPYAHAGQIAMPIVHQHFIVRRCGQGRELPATDAISGTGTGSRVPPGHAPQIFDTPTAEEWRIHGPLHIPETPPQGEPPRASCG